MSFPRDVTDSQVRNAYAAIGGHILSSEEVTDAVTIILRNLRQEHLDNFLNPGLDQTDEAAKRTDEFHKGLIKGVDDALDRLTNREWVRVELARLAEQLQEPE